MTPTTPKSTTPTAQKRTKFTDNDLVTVLHGYGKLAHSERHFVDTVLFTGGVARDVPYSLAKHWKAGTRPDGKSAIGKVFVQILPQSATEADFVRATGKQPMPTSDLVDQMLG